LKADRKISGHLGVVLYYLKNSGLVGGHYCIWCLCLSGQGNLLWTAGKSLGIWTTDLRGKRLLVNSRSRCKTGVSEKSWRALVSQKNYSIISHLKCVVHSKLSFKKRHVINSVKTVKLREKNWIHLSVARGATTDKLLVKKVVSS